MALRLVEIVLPAAEKDALDRALADLPIVGRWESTAEEQGDLVCRVLTQTETAEAVMDAFETQFATVAEARAMVFAVEATLPRANQEEARAETGERPGEQAPPSPRISREELHASLEEASQLGRVYLVTVVVSTVVAAVGLLRNDVAVIIGAMVIAPLLGPNVAGALATTLADGALAKRAITTGLVGLALAFLLAMGIGLLFPFEPTSPSIALRMRAGPGDVVLALAAGCAGALAFTSGASAAVVGVMVAVALLPPVVVLGLLVGRGDLSDAFGALLLLATNVICVNLAAVVTFLAQGIRPRSWWEADRARHAIRIALVVWVVLLAVLVLLMVLSARHR